jgi:hypothetical protein
MTLKAIYLRFLGQIYFILPKFFKSPIKSTFRWSVSGDKDEGKADIRLGEITDVSQVVSLGSLF